MMDRLLVPVVLLLLFVRLSRGDDANDRVALPVAVTHDQNPKTETDPQQQCTFFPAGGQGLGVWPIASSRAAGYTDGDDYLQAQTPLVPIQSANAAGVRHALCHPVQLVCREDAAGETATEGSGGN